MTSCPSAGPPDPDVRQDFLCRQPIQFRLEEYLTFSPWLPLPVEIPDGFDGHVVRNLSASEEESTVGIVSCLWTRLSYFLRSGREFNFLTATLRNPTITSRSALAARPRAAETLVMPWMSLSQARYASFVLISHVILTLPGRHPVDLRRPGAPIASSDGFGCPTD